MLREGAANERRGSGEEERRTSSRGGNEQQIAAALPRKVFNESKTEGRKSTLSIMGRCRAEEADCRRFSLSVFSCVAGDEARLLPRIETGQMKRLIR